MIDEIFEMIMKEARSRKGKDLVQKLASVQMDLNLMIGQVMETFRRQQEEENDDR